jgi:hypothetical protein
MVLVTVRIGRAPPPGVLPGVGWGAVASEDFGAVGAAGCGGAVGVEGDGPAPLVDADLVMVEAVQPARLDAGLAAVGLMDQVVHFARCGGLVAAAGVLPLSAQETEQASWKMCSPRSMTVADGA